MEDDKQERPGPEQPKERRATERQAAAGRENLLKFRPDAPGLKHGVKATIASGGEIPAAIPGAEEISAAVEEIIQQMVSDLGYSSEASIPAQKRALLAAQRLCLKVLMLADRYIATEGLVIKGRANPLLTVAATYINSMRLNSERLGMERVPRDVTPDLQTYLTRTYGESSPERSANAEAAPAGS
jgi:hypothetical protein